MAQALFTRMWSSGFLPTQHQGVKFRNKGDPVLYLSNPAGVTRELRRGMLDEIAALKAHMTSSYSSGRELAADIVWALINQPEFYFNH